VAANGSRLARGSLAEFAFSLDFWRLFVPCREADHMGLRVENLFVSANGQPAD
jgi:hypothetical protein